MANLEPQIEELIKRASQGDAEAFGNIYDLYADRVYRHIYYRTGNTEDARDMTQDVFSRAWKVLPKYKLTDTPILGWLFTISHNRVIDYYRSKKEHAYLDNEITIESGVNDPKQSAEDELKRQEIRKAILHLPDDQQRVLILSFIEGFEYREIARMLNKSEGNIRVLVHRALKKLRELLKREDF